MLKSMTAMLVACIFVLSCNVQSDHVEHKASESSITPDSKSGITLENMDTKVRPQDDFYRYVNGTWLEKTVIPADKSVYSSFTEIFDINETRLKTIIEETAARQGSKPSSPEQQIGDFYQSFMNTELLQKLGVSVLDGAFKRIDAAKSHEDIWKLMAHLAQLNVYGPVSFSVSIDGKNSSSYIMHLNQSGLSLPDRSYYLEAEEKMVIIRTQFREHLEKMFGLAGIPEGAAKAGVVLDIETRLATYQWTRVKSRDRSKTYNKYSVSKLDAEAKGFPWLAFFKEVGSTGDVIVRQPDFFQKFSKMYDTVSVDHWQTYFKWHLLNTYSDLLTTEIVAQDFAFFGTTLNGITEIRPRWKRAVGSVNDLLGELVGKVYVEKHFKPEAKQRMEELVDNLKATFAERLQQLDWMSQETKKEALNKLSKFNAKIGYPEKWRDYSKLTIKSDDLFGNYLRANKVEFDRNLARLGQPIDKDEWFMNPQTVNAYYSSTQNEIVFPAAILQPPFFDLDADMAANYGGIGAVIGHEITHGFDDQGRKSDGDGNLREWWSEQDGVEFDKRANRMVEQYNGYKPLEDVAVNGNLTLGENIADLGGLTMAFYAYKRYLNGQPAPVIDNFTGEQRVFLSWAQSWRRKYREEALRQRLATDTHSPGEFRAIGATSNMPEFYRTFKVMETDKMYRDESVRVKIW